MAASNARRLATRGGMCAVSLRAVGQRPVGLFTVGLRTVGLRTVGLRAIVLTTVAVWSVASAAAFAQGAAAAQSPRPTGARAAAPARQAPCPTEPALFQPCALARMKTFAPPRTRDGRPNFQGFWRGMPAATENIEAHPENDDDNGGPSLIIDPADGKIPYQAWAKAQIPINREKYIEPNVPCFPSGTPRSLYVPTQIQFLQSPGYLLIMFERAHTYRIIPTTPRPALGSGIRLWQGDSRGRWEGNTLVVNATNHNAKAWFDQAGNFYSPAASMVERFTLIDANTMHYQVTLTDPATYTRPWTMAFPLRRNTEKGFYLLEEACHEGERNTQPLIEGGQAVYPGLSGPATP